MRNDERDELRRRVEELHRDHSDWTAREIELELRERAAVAYGNWVDETRAQDSRLRSIQRWRGASRWVASGPVGRSAFPFLWPVGERQRQEVDPSFTPSRAVSAGSWRLFLYNCGPEIVRDVRVSLDGTVVGYAPAILMGKFSEVPWQKVESIKAESLAGTPGGPSGHALVVDFVVARGTRESRLDGKLWFDPAQGWRIFQSREERSTDIE